MSIYANIAPTPQTGGLFYSQGMVIPAAEGELGNQPGSLAPPIATLYGQAITAIIELSTVGAVLTNSTYVVMQTDLGDGVWIDLAWCTWTGTGTAKFCLADGMDGANSFQVRTQGVAPTPANGSNQMPLGGRIRFVGKSTVTTAAASSSSSAKAASSSAAPAVTPGVLATIKYLLLGLR